MVAVLLLDGRKAIARVLSEYTGVDISVEQVRRLERRKADPLPTRPLGRGARMRRVASPQDISAWCSREYGVAKQ